jgi:hypothetical protein
MVGTPWWRDEKRKWSHASLCLAGGWRQRFCRRRAYPIDVDVITPEFLTQYKQWWASELGVTDVSFMDTRDRQEAETQAFVAPAVPVMWPQGQWFGPPS